MPRAYERCVRNGGRVRTVKPNQDQYLRICYDSDTDDAHADYVKTRKSAQRRRSASRRSASRRSAARRSAMRRSASRQRSPPTVLNPETGRRVRVGGPTYQDLVRRRVIR